MIVPEKPLWGGNNKLCVYVWITGCYSQLFKVLLKCYMNEGSSQGSCIHTCTCTLACLSFSPSHSDRILAIFQLGNFFTTESIFTVETGVDLRPYSVENIQNIWMKWYCTVMSSQAYLQDGINVFTIQLLVKLLHFLFLFTCDIIRM